MDFIRRSYSVQVKPWRNSSQSVLFHWRPAAPNAEYLPVPSCINSRNWDANPWRELDVGEISDTAKFEYTTPIPGSGQGHYCGTPDQWLNGDVYDPSLPPVTYNPQNLPACCEPVSIESEQVDFRFGGYFPVLGSSTFVITNGGIALIQGWMAVGPARIPDQLWLHLYTNQPIITPTTVVGDLVEATFTGYSPQLIHDADWTVGSAVNGRINSIAPNSAIAYIIYTPGYEQDIYGMYLTYGIAGPLVAAWSFEEPVQNNYVGGSAFYLGVSLDCIGGP